MTKPIPSLAFPEILDNTKITAYAKCPRYFYYGHILNLKPLRESIHLHAGKAYASTLDAFRKAYYTPDAPTYRDLFESQVIAFRELLTVYGYDEELESSEDWTKSPKSALRMFECFLAMLDEYPPATDPIQPAIINGEPAIELSFTLEMSLPNPDTGEPILQHGRFDMLAEYNNSYFVFDDKTTSSLGPQWNKQWEFRSQFTGYCMGAQTFGLPISGAIVRGHSIQKTQFKFAQPITYRKSHQIDEWWQDSHSIVHQMIESYKRAKKAEPSIGTLQTRKYFPATGMFNEGCNQYSGCPYRQLCSAKRPERWLSEYQIKVWDPRNPD